MKYPDFLELTTLVDDDILLVHQSSTSALRGIKLSTLKQYVGVAATPVYSTETTAVIKAIQATGITLTAAQKEACNNRIADMKTSGVWAKRIAYYGFLGGTANAHSVNWKSPGTYNINWLGNMVHSSNGINSDGNTGYGDTGLTESLFNQASTHISIYSRTTEGFGNLRDVGNIVHDNFQLIIAYQGVGYYRSFSSQTDLEGSNPPSKTGYFTGTRSSTTAQSYRNAVAYKTATSSADSIIKPGNIGICRAFTDYTTKQFASVGLGSGLTQAEVTNDFNSEQAYQTALNRQV